MLSFGGCVVQSMYFAYDMKTLHYPTRRYEMFPISALAPSTLDGHEVEKRENL
jgi:hypothetical protein